MANTDIDLSGGWSVGVANDRIIRYAHMIRQLAEEIKSNSNTVSTDKVFRTVTCTTQSCSQFRRTWTVQPILVQPGLICWPTVQCTGCGTEPTILVA